MTTSTYDTPATTGIDRNTLALEATAQKARRMQIPEAQVACSLALSVWTTPEEMIEREFAGACRGCSPKCSMEPRAEAVMAEVFDQLAITLGDPRRALRAGAWTPPGGWTGGRFDGRGPVLEPGRPHRLCRTLCNDFDPEDVDLWAWAYDDLVATVRASLSAAWGPVERGWRDRSSRIVTRNGLHEVWLTGDGCYRVHGTFGVRERLDETEALARHSPDDCAKAFFDALRQVYPLHVRTSARTGAPCAINCSR